MTRVNGDLFLESKGRCCQDINYVLVKNKLCPTLLTFKMEGEDPQAKAWLQASRSKKKSNKMDSPRITRNVTLLHHD